MKLEVKNNNKKITLLYIHGYNSNGLSIGSLLEKDANFNIVYFNYPTDKIYNTTELAEEIDKAIKRIKGPIVIMGHSLGGAVMSHIKDKRKIKKFIFLSALNPTLMKNKGWQFLLSETRTGKILQKVISKTINLISDGFFANFLNPAKKWSRFINENILNQEYLESHLDAAYKSKAKKSITIIGTEDKLFDYNYYNDYMKKIGIEKQFTIQNGSHSVVQGYADELLKILNSEIQNKNKRRKKIIKGE